jgi:hypothetical protein
MLERMAHGRSDPPARSDTEWFKDRKWGVFIHFLGRNGESTRDWNRRVDRFDVTKLADQLVSIGAGYIFLTVGQNSGHYCCPNPTYDAHVGIVPSGCSERDLVSDLHGALEGSGVRTMAYLPSGAPAADPVAMERLAWSWGFEGKWPDSNGGPTGERLAEFQAKWESIIREWSLRWGRKVSGWWIDGCYFADAMYRFPEPPNFESFRDALKAGNPEALVAFNPGVEVPVISLTPYEDFTAGEISKAFPACPGRWVDGVQYHVLSYLGERWGGGHPRFVDEFPAAYTRDVNRKEGVVTWEVPILDDGSIPAPFLRQLGRLSAGHG